MLLDYDDFDLFIQCEELIEPLNISDFMNEP